LLWLTSVGLLRLLRCRRPLPDSERQDARACLRLTVAGMLVGLLGDRLGYPWWAYYSVAVIALLTLVPALHFDLGVGAALGYVGLRLVTLPIVYIATALCLRVLVLPIAARLPVTRGFELGHTLGWSHEVGALHGALIVPDPAGTPGNRVARFELRPGDPPVNLGYRAELSEFSFKAPFGQPLAYRFRTYIPESWHDQDTRCVIAQWHAWGDWVIAEALRSPVLALEYRDGAFLIRSAHNARWRQSDNSPASNQMQIHYRGREHATKGVWHDFLIHVRWSPGDDGWLRVWIDGDEVVDYQGPIGYRDLLGPYFKFGLYRDPTPESVVIYHDAYHRRAISP
jgi:hypothetical protein